MRIEVLTHAKEDLFDGYVFYERQQAGITVDDLCQHEDVLLAAVERLLHQFHELEQNRERLL